MIRKEKTTAQLIQDDDLAKKYNRKFSSAKNFCQTRHEAYAENTAFYQGNQDILKKYKNDRPWVVNMNTPYAAIAIDTRVSSLITNNYMGELFPLSPEDIKPMEIMNKLIRNDWKKMGIDDMIDDSIGDGAVVRESYIHIVVNKNKKYGSKNRVVKGVLEAHSIDAGSIYIDPNARNLKDSGYVVVPERILKSIAMREYPELEEWKDNLSSMSTPADRGEIFLGNDYTTEQNDIFTKRTFYEKDVATIERRARGISGKLGLKEKVTRPVILKTIMIEDKVVEQYYIPVTNYPISQFRWKKAKQSCYGLSLMDDVLCLQKSINAIESAITNAAVAYASPSIVVRKGSGLNPKQVAKTVGAPGVVYAVDGDPKTAIATLTPPQIEDKIVALKKDNELAIDKITGADKQFSGDLGTVGNTAGGAEKAIARATQIENKIIRNITEFVRDLTQIIYEHEVYLHAGQSVDLRGEKDNVTGDFKFESIKVPDNIEDLDYEFYINLVKRSPYNKEREKEKLMELFTIQEQYGSEIKAISVIDIIKAFDFENEDEIIARYNEMLKSTSNKKSDLIQTLIALGTSQGIPQDMISQAITEIIINSEKTPTSDTIMKLTSDRLLQKKMANEQKVNEANGQIEESSQKIQELGISPEAMQGAVKLINNSKQR